MAKVLVVEDDPFLQHTLRRVLEFHKLPVEVTANGQEGLEKADTLKPNVILLNAMLENMNGLEILKKLKENKATKDIPVIVLANFTEDEIIAKAKSLGAADCIVKSEFTPDQIVDKVRAYL